MSVYIIPLRSFLQGCYFHGCRDHYKRETVNKVNGHKMGDLYDRTMERTASLRRAGYRVTEMWECAWKTELKENEGKRRAVSEFRIPEPLTPRAALCGGRTNAFSLYARAFGEWVLRYYDIKSLCPYVQKSKRFMVGDPIILTENFGDVATILERYEGFIQCTVLPPKQLLIPLLPYKYGGKLLFPLCRTCAEG